MVDSTKSNIDKSWQEKLGDVFESPQMKELRAFLTSELQKGKVIFPHGKEIFSAFNQTPFNEVKVVILGQDPYHGDHQAHGMAFSVKPGIAIPPSLRNIYKELHNDLNIQPPKHGHLLDWAKQGVFLLNTCLTVEKGKAGSHHKKGWEFFTNHVIDVLSKEKENLVFILWGSPAQKKAHKVDTSKHLVLKSPHPSPLSAHRGFFGSGHFSKANDYLKKTKQKPIDWEIKPL